ncbi:nucleolar protein gar2 [Forsythia ovata]|uniref:Nucleolar protein gar2 n=2 Tax=Forsythia ovata TaxID=205694 RepID=A0ABD1WBZ1_9LAMI
MVLGLRSKHRKGASVKVDYIVHVQEIRPWPPTESLRSIQTVLLQWENGDKNSGSFISVAGNSNISFNESFILPFTLRQDKKAHDKFLKNYLEFSLFEPRKDKGSKGQLLGTALLNLADYGLLEEILSISIPLNFKKSSKNSVQSALFVSLEPVEKDSSNSSPNSRLSKAASLDNDDNDSEIASFTDDDTSSHSSRTAVSSTFEAATASPSQNEKNGTGLLNAGIDPIQEPNKSIWPSSIDVSSDTGNRTQNYTSLSKFPERSMTSVKRNSATPSIKSSTSFIGIQDINGKSSNRAGTLQQASVNRNANEEIAKTKAKISEITQQSQSVKDESSDRFLPKFTSSNNSTQTVFNSNSVNLSHASQEKKVEQEATEINDAHIGLVNGGEKREQINNGQDEKIMEETKLVEDASRRQTMRSDTLVPNRKAPGILGFSTNNARLKHAMSIQIHDSINGNGFVGDSAGGIIATDLDIPDSQNIRKGNAAIERKEPKSKLSESKNEWKSRIEMLEEELRETAAVEVGLYSVIAEHTSSSNKVHAPARRLSRFYLHACRAGSQAKRASAARAALSGLVLVSKACGNDVPRLTFWLSNSIMLRAIVSQAAAEMPRSVGSGIKSNGIDPGMTFRFLDNTRMEKEKYKSIKESDDWEDILMFIIALEKIESWIFSRIVESVWWQTLTPHMQPMVAKSSGRTTGSSTKKTYGRRHNLGDHEQGNFSTELWKKAFKDACERLCPIRAGGHDCGCLSVLARLVMEQLVDRLDMAMFNAILRESAEEMPTDPVSDPITDSKVLPIPAGKSSFGAGAQLKNAIGNWSRWLTDLFGIEDDVPVYNNIIVDDQRPKSFKAFRLLHALSDLMMLPFGMLADVSIRKEVCPTFDPTLIKRVFSNFVPDEFCPDPIPQNIIESLDSEEIPDASVELLTSYPCTASPTVYSPPPAASLNSIMGEVGTGFLQRSGSSILKKSYTSDDELDELDSPLTSIIPDSFQSSSALAKLSSMPQRKGGRNVLRFQLLRESWEDSEQ